MKEQKIFYSINKYHIIHAVKAAAAALCAILLAEMFHLQYTGSCAVIALITLAGTKKETFRLSFKRLVTFMITMFISFALYQIVGIHYLSFALFIFILALISYGLGMYATLSANAVIATHILSAGSLTAELIINEVLLVVIGTVTAVIINLYMPDDSGRLRASIERIEAAEKNVLRNLAAWLMEEQREDVIRAQLKNLEDSLKEASAYALRNKDNILASHAAYYVKYMDMRREQCSLLIQMTDSFAQLTYRPEQAEVLAELFMHTAEIFNERNNGSILLLEMETIEASLQEQELPSRREEFENRAILYHALLQLKKFLTLKKEFADSLTDEQMDVYWKRGKK